MKKCCEIYEEVKSALGIVPSKAGKYDEAIKNIRNFVTKQDLSASFDIKMRQINSFLGK